MNTPSDKEKHFKHVMGHIHEIYYKGNIMESMSDRAKFHWFMCELFEAAGITSTRTENHPKEMHPKQLFGELYPDGQD